MAVRISAVSDVSGQAANIWVKNCPFKTKMSGFSAPLEQYQ